MARTNNKRPTPKQHSPQRRFSEYLKGWAAGFGLWLIKSPWRWMIYILLFEALLIRKLKPTILTDHPGLQAFTDIVHRIPNSFDMLYAHMPHPEPVRLYVSVTVALILPKVALWCWGFMRDSNGAYRHLVISPLTGYQPKSAGEFVNHPLDQHTGKEQQKGRSPGRDIVGRIAWSFAILAFAGLTVLAVILTGDGAEQSNAKIISAMRAVSPKMWSSWVIYRTTFASLLLAISACIIKDYFVFFYRIAINIGRRK